MELIAFIGQAQPVLIMALVIMAVYQSVQTKTTKDDVAEIKNNAVWKDRFEEVKEDHNRRICRIEKLQNGKLQQIR